MKTEYILPKHGRALKLLCGDCEIPDRVAAPIRVGVPHALLGSHVCLQGSKIIKRLAIEPTISSVEKGHVTVALAVNTTGSQIKIKHGPKLGDCLLSDRKVVTNPLEFPTAWVAQTWKSSFDTDIIELGSSIDLVVKVVDYPELKSSLTDLLGHYRSVLAFPGKFLGVADRAVYI